MHEIVFYLAFVWMTVLLVVSAAAVIRLRSTASRILALDMLTLILVALLVLYADAQRSRTTWTPRSSSRSWPSWRRSP